MFMFFLGIVRDFLELGCLLFSPFLWSLFPVIAAGRCVIEHGSYITGKFEVYWRLLSQPS